MSLRREWRVYGPRQEIIDEITRLSLAPGRSERRQREGARAVVALETDSADQVTYAGQLWIVETPGE